MPVPKKPWRLRKRALPKPKKGVSPEAYWVKRALTEDESNTVDDWKMLVQMPVRVAARGLVEAGQEGRRKEYVAKLLGHAGHLSVVWMPQWIEGRPVRLEVVLSGGGATLAHKIGDWPDVLIDCFEEAVKRVSGADFWDEKPEGMLELLKEGCGLARKLVD